MVGQTLNRGHKLMTAELRKQIPALGYWVNHDNPLREATISAKYFAPYTGWTWYVLEYDGQDTFFGLVDGFEMEYGYFTLSELENAVHGNSNLPAVERDLYWTPVTVAEVKGR